MDKTTAIKRHRERLARLTNTEARNLMEHAANETPLLPVDEFKKSFVDAFGLC